MKPRRPWLDARRSPAATALVVGERAVGRAELAARAAALAAWLGAQGVGAGDRVAALLPGGLAFAALLHAVDRAGATLLPLNTRLAAAEIAFVLRDARPRILLHGEGALAERAARAVGLSGDAAPALRVCTAPAPDGLPSGSARAPGGSPDDPLALLYTSGTTGRPKGALLTHANFRASVDASHRHLGASPCDRWLACLPLFHVGGLSILLRAARHGHAVVLHERFDPEAVSRALDAAAISHVSLVPTMLGRLLEARGVRRAPPRLRTVLLGGGPAAPALLERARKLGFPLAPTYGLTEAASQVATLVPGAGDPVRDGLPPLPGTELRIVGDDGRPLGPGAVGEIAVRGPTVMAGYWNRPEDTRRALRSGWLHTGDLGRLDAAGRLVVLDRRSDLIVSGGENVYPAEVEAALVLHPDVLEAGVAGVPDADYGQRPAAWVVPAAGAHPMPEALARFCRDHLAGYKVPCRFELVERLPRNASGKLQRQRLRETRP